MTNFPSVLFNTQSESLMYGGHISTFRNVILDSIMKNNKALKGCMVDSYMITVAFLQYSDLFVLAQMLQKNGEGGSTRNTK